jgi:hypothetical protein
MALPQKAMYRFSAIPIKVLMSFFTEIEKSIVKLIFGAQKTPKSQINPDQKIMLEVSQFLLQITLQRHNNKNSMILAQKQTHIPME